MERRIPITSFASFLQARNLPEATITRFLKTVDEFEAFIQRTGGQKSSANAGAEEVEAFAALLIQEGANDSDSFYALNAYGSFIKNRALAIAALELIDGAEVMGNLHRKLGEAAGVEKRDQVFHGVALPPAGTPTRHLPVLMRTVMTRMESLIEPDARRRILNSGLRNLDRSWYPDARDKFLACANLDEFLAVKGRDFLAELEKHHRTGELFYTQEITAEVIEFVRQNPLIREGVHEGGCLYEVKIPYMTRQYLEEKDEQRKRYYYCHCPWVRGALLNGPSGIPDSFCRCSSAYHKLYWEAVFDRDLEAEVVESVLKGDLWCKFKIHLPEEYA